MGGFRVTPRRLWLLFAACFVSAVVCSAVGVFLLSSVAWLLLVLAGWCVAVCVLLLTVDLGVQ